MKEQEFIIKNKLGLHARAASLLVELVSKFDSDVTIVKDNQEVDGKSIMGIMTLAAGEGTSIKVRAEGGDEDRAIEEVGKLIEEKFYEE